MDSISIHIDRRDLAPVAKIHPAVEVLGGAALIGVEESPSKIPDLSDRQRDIASNEVRIPTDRSLTGPGKDVFGNDISGITTDPATLRTIEESLFDNKGIPFARDAGRRRR